MLLASEPPEHQLDHAALPQASLVVPAVDPATAQPGERPLHHPTPLDHPDALAPRRPALHLDHVPAALGDPFVQPVVVVLVVRPELLQTGERLSGQIREHLRGRRPVVGRGAGDGHHHEQAPGYRLR